MILGDDNPLRPGVRPVATLALLLACGIVFVAQMGQDDAGIRFAMLPAALRADPASPIALLSLFTYQFLHAGWLHLAGNLLALFVFGDNVEDAFGPRRFLLFYLLCGTAGGIAHAIATPSPDVPLFGASGAIAGVMAAYLLLYPRAKLFVLAFARWPTLVPASWFVAAWIGLNILRSVLAPEAEVAWWAHIGGFCAGLVLTLLLRPRGVALFQPVMASPTPRWPWFRRFAFDFAPEAGPRHADPQMAGATMADGRAAAIGKAILFIILALFSAWG